MRITICLAIFLMSCSGSDASGGGGGGGGDTGGGSAAGGGVSTGGGSAGGMSAGGGLATGGGSAQGGGSSTGGGAAVGGGSSTGGGSAAGGGSTSADGGYLPDPVVTGHVLEVCPTGCMYNLPHLAFDAAVNGDTIQIDYGLYTDCGTITKDNIIVRGVPNAAGARPRMGGMTCNRKGIIIVQGGNTLIEGLELHDAVDPTTMDMNWACVRFDSLASARNLKLRDCWLHDADDGLLGNNTSTAPNTVVIESCLFENLGRAGYAHGMYLGTAVDLFVIRNSIVRHNHDDGHLVKSRAIQNILECNTIAALDGLNSYAIDLPQGGNATVRSNVVEQGPHINNGGDFFINFAEENGNNAPHSLSVHDNQFVNDYSGQGQINVAIAGTPTPNWFANTYVGAGGSMALPNYTGSNSFDNTPTRALAGLPAYDGGIGCLPAAPVCP
jgi:hypothetical protein